MGLRSNYVASRLAADIMTHQKRGLIINISYHGGRRYFNNVAYGVCKAVVDRLSADTAVAVFSLYPGQVSTEGMHAYAQYGASVDLSKMETPQFIRKMCRRVGVR